VPPSRHRGSKKKGSMSIEHEEQRVPLPQEVREESTAFTSIYNQGKLVYDGAAARVGEQGASAGGAGSGDVPTSLNEMLKWGVSNSNPDELKRMADSGAAPKQMDKEIMDMLLGEPIVAKMRACLGKLGDGGQLPDGTDAALEALEELEYYVEDIDNAVDMAKIGGLQTLKACLTGSPAAEDVEVREAACSVMAAALQNNPKVQEAALALEMPSTLLQLLQEAEDDSTLPVRRKALLAVSALCRSSPAAVELLLGMADGIPTLVAVGANADAKLRRRALFLLLNLSRGAPAVAARLLSAPALCPTLLEAACDADEDTREQGLLLLLLLSEREDAGALCAQLLELDASALLSKALAAGISAGEERNREHDEHFRNLIAWLAGAD